jgi:drug/metabolite transporter (DMT)-like permease
MQWSYSNAVSRLPVGIALLVEYTAVIWVPLASKAIWGEKTKPRLWLGVALVLGGLVAISQIWNGGLDLAGVGFAFLAALLLSTFFIMGEHTQQSRDPISTMFYTMCVSTLFWFCFSPWWQFDASRLGSTINLTQNLGAISVPFSVMLIWIGLAGASIPMLLSYAALSQITATSVGIISTTEVVFAALFGWLWLNETMDGLQLLGGVLLIAGIIIAQTARIRRDSNGNH